MENLLRSACAESECGRISRSWISKVISGICVLVVFATPAGAVQPPSRSVRGVVTDTRGSPVPDAVVQIENLSTLEIRSCITQKEGQYSFRELNPDVDYSLRAEVEGQRGAVKTLSRFDSRREAVINLKVGKNH